MRSTWTTNQRAAGLGRGRLRRRRPRSSSAAKPASSGTTTLAAPVQPQDPRRALERAQHHDDAAVLAQVAIVSAPLPTTSR